MRIKPAWFPSLLPPCPLLNRLFSDSLGSPALPHHTNKVVAARSTLINRRNLIYSCDGQRLLTKSLKTSKHLNALRGPAGYVSSQFAPAAHSHAEYQTQQAKNIIWGMVEQDKGQQLKDTRLEIFFITEKVYFYRMLYDRV